MYPKGTKQFVISVPVGIACDGDRRMVTLDLEVLARDFDEAAAVASVCLSKAIHREVIASTASVLAGGKP